MTDSELFDKINNSPLILAYFSYPECSVCKTLRPKIKELVKQFDTVEYLYVDTHKHPAVGAQNLVFSVPTVLILERGKEVKRFSRIFTLSDVRALLERATATLS